MKEASDEQYHCNEPSYELEVVEVVGVNRRRRVDLQRVIVLACVLEQAIHRVEYFMRQIEKPLSEKHMRLLVYNSSTSK